MKQYKTILVALFALGTASAHAQVLELGNLAGYDYAGQDEINSRSTCHLSVSPIAKDFSGRLYQDFRVWVDGRTDLSFNIRLRGSDRSRSPDRMVENRYFQYNIALDDYLLEVLSETSDSLQLRQFNWVDTTGISGTPNTLIRCQNVRRTPR